MPIERTKRRAYNAKAWRELSRRLREERAGWRCECEDHCGIGHRGRCRATEGERLRGGASHVRLSVAHLDHSAAGEGRDEEANLLVMCGACHLRFDSEQHWRARRAANTCTRTLPLFGEQ